MRLSGCFAIAASYAAWGDAEIGEAAERLDEVVVRVEHVEAIAQILDWITALEHDPAAADDARLVHPQALALIHFELLLEDLEGCRQLPLCALGSLSPRALCLDGTAAEKVERSRRRNRLRRGGA
jgi:hypothetical protein